MCGGTQLQGEAAVFDAGLSPRVRGHPRHVSRMDVEPGSIPACAGAPILISKKRLPVEVYPRVCGGTKTTQIHGNPKKGLSPRVRGHPMSAPPPPEKRGSIPACAGAPSQALEGGGEGGVYPRVCGGTLPTRTTGTWRRGLSPRVRGHRISSCFSERNLRSIPACAGAPCNAETWNVHEAVYPRVCGGTLFACVGDGYSSGLSPRVRGHHALCSDPPGWQRSIPACAGAPKWWERSTPQTQVYPRVCGGTSYITSATQHKRGLSPRVRGHLDRSVGS